MRKRTSRELLVWTDTLSKQGVKLAELKFDERMTLKNNWNLAFASKVKKEHGVYVYRGYRWHAYSYQIVQCIDGDAALEQYLGEAPAPFYLFDESMEICGMCKASRFPDLTSLGDDVYVVHHQMHWSMAFTHEQPHIGPFFHRPG